MNNQKNTPLEQETQKTQSARKFLGVFERPLTSSAKTTIASCLFFFVCVIIGITLMMGFVGIFVALIVEAIMVFLLLYAQKKRTQQTTCEKCGAHFTFATDVAYQFVTRSVKTYKFNANQSGKQIKSGEDHKFLVNCTCSQCGEKKQFHHNVRMRSIYYDGSVEDTDLNEAFETYFEKDALTEVDLKFKLALIGAGIAFVLAVIFAINAPSGM